jgi:YYY domain-containing protein
LIGALPFLNFWDILPYGFIVVAAFAIARFRAERQWTARVTRDLVTFVASLGVVSLVLYLPFYVGFQSQAGGILPVLFVKTQLHQYLIMFGVFVFVFGFFLLHLIREHRGTTASEWARRSVPFLFGAVAFPLVVVGIVMLLLSVSPALRDQAFAAFPDSTGNLFANVLSAYFGPLVSDPWLFVLLAVMMAGVLVLLQTRILHLEEMDASITFVLLILFTGLLLTFSVEFVYLRDVFGTRMNTVFKFYFQTWTMFSIAAAFAIYYLSRSLQGIARGIWFTGLGFLLAAGLIYPAAGIPNRAEYFKRPATLDGIEWIRNFSPGDYAGITWLNEHAPADAHILESTGRQYSYDDRISMATGLPTVLGWMGHEDQWRGGSKLYKNDAAGIDRPADVARIYQTLDAQEALTLLDKYAINFVVVGGVERSVYNLTPAQVDKFSKVLTLVFENGDLRIYAHSQ